MRRFNGLDRPVALPTDVEELTDPEMAYVALTRPSVLLMVFGTQGAVGRIRVGPAADEEED